MSEVPKQGSQLDRIEGLLAQVLDRLTRMEERQNAQSAQIDSHAIQLSEYSQRIRELEVQLAVAAASGKAQTRALNGRWAAVGAASLVILGAIGAFVGNAVIKLLHIGS
ncbi:hypothetical protein [Halomonas lysinitropha]|uniref:Uncharacterized protein n=1 Tax=Halomonas lysinitropha TaxID=2607506 RepID=A0A5K1IB29_9GAMM|nr:hypothetical protein [Halomonas lysinitropha]VVZ96492.1 hypothetical protein HALO32_02593 [Halomonas lysinitropha]